MVSGVQVLNDRAGRVRDEDGCTHTYRRLLMSVTHSREMREVVNHHARIQQ